MLGHRIHGRRGHVGMGGASNSALPAAPRALAFGALPQTAAARCISRSSRRWRRPVRENADQMLARMDIISINRPRQPPIISCRRVA